ncbi:Protein of unknown function [Bacillus mycoides]|nr:Protein of unknown function [Bacillus mycoides]
MMGIQERIQPIMVNK